MHTTLPSTERKLHASSPGYDGSERPCPNGNVLFELLVCHFDLRLPNTHGLAEALAT